MPGVFVRAGTNQLTELREATYDSERALQELLAHYPNLLAGDQIDPKVPRKWLLVSREMGIPGLEDGGDRWSVDHLFLDQDGIPTLVEVKRSNDTRIRREVVGQMLDYAANAVSYWSRDRILATYEAACIKRGEKFDERLNAFIGEAADPGAFWQTVEANLQRGQIRMVFVADELPLELRRVIEFLNEQMALAEVLGIQIKRYVGDNGLETFIPQVFGLTTAAIDRKSADPLKWDELRFFAALEANAGSSATAVGKQLLAWANSRGYEIYWGEGQRHGSFSPRIVVDGAKYQFFAAWTYGSVSLYLDVLSRKPALMNSESFENFIAKLRRIPGVVLPEDCARREPVVNFAQLQNSDAMNAFTSAFDELAVSIRSWRRESPS